MFRSDFLRAYFGQPAVRLYIVLALCSAVVLFSIFRVDLTVLASAAFLAAYPIIEYALDRFLLHSPFFYRARLTARLWKRIHYDHHQDPDDADVIFGAIETMLPVAVLFTHPLGWLVGGNAGALSALTTGLLVISAYELFHCAAHLPITPKTRYARYLKRMHLLHHFHNEKGNFGITSPICDILFGTYYANPKEVQRSPTARNLGYTEQLAAVYPWVSQLTLAKDGGDGAPQ